LIYATSEPAKELTLPPPPESPPSEAEMEQLGAIVRRYGCEIPGYGVVEGEDGVRSETQKGVLDLRSVFGLKATVTTPSATTDGEYVELDCTVEPGGDTAIHYHPEQEETYQVLDGTLEVFRDGRWHAVAVGESLTVPRGAVHGFRNAHRPALAFQEHLETLDRLVQEGRSRVSKVPAP
jgi:quercetin dioxygenase-like cupin family protein